MTHIRLLVSDIDGTLVRTDKSLSDTVVTAIRRVAQLGVPVSLISARPPSGMYWIAEKIGLECALGAFNGATIFRPDGTIISASYLSPEQVISALARLERPGIAPWLFADGQWYATTREGDHVPHEIKAAGLEPTICTDFSRLHDRVDKIVGVSDDHDLLVKIETEIQRDMAGSATVARSQPYYLDVTAQGGNKGDGLKALAAQFGTPLDAVAVLGDQNNDLPMFALAGLSIAMGQAPRNVREAAGHVARTNDDDGVADAIKRFVLPRIDGDE
ncbi:MAG: Cof-type HAD-IIB family hydrolase [Pseudomonadota bacterium]